MRYTRSPAALRVSVTFKPRRRRKAEIAPRTECGCQPVASISCRLVAPCGRNHASIGAAGGGAQQQGLGRSEPWGRVHERLSGLIAMPRFTRCSAPEPSLGELPPAGRLSSGFIHSRRLQSASVGTMTTEPWVSVEQVAQHLGVAKDTVYRWREHRGLPAHRVGRLWKFKLSEVDDWVRAGGADEEKQPQG